MRLAVCTPSRAAPTFTERIFQSSRLLPRVTRHEPALLERHFAEAENSLREYYVSEL